MTKSRKRKKKRKHLTAPQLILALLILALLIVNGSRRAPDAIGTAAQTVQERAADRPAPAAEPTAEPTPEPTPEPTVDVHADLRLSEIMPKNRTALRAPDGSFPDWIELYNADSQPADIGGWRLSDKDSGGWTLPARTLQPGEYLLVYADGSGRSEEGMLCTDFSLSSGETVTLFSPGGSPVDQIELSTETANHSLARKESGELVECSRITPGMPNTHANAESYAASLSPSGPLCINEVVVSNNSDMQQYGQYFDWIELKNISSESVQLADYYLSDDADEPLRYRLPERVLAPGRTYVLFCSGDEPRGSIEHAGFSLDAQEEDLLLTAASGSLVDYVYLHDIPANGSMGRQSDSSGWSYYLTATPDAENGRPPVFIDKTYLAVNDTLRVFNGAGCTFTYSVGGNERNESELVLSADDYEKWIDVKAYEDGRLIAEDRAYFSKLPVIYIDTVRGAGIYTKTDYVVGKMTIQGNSQTDRYEYAGGIQIRGRGNTTWNWWPKKPYRVKLDNKTDLYGMGSSRHWALLSNYLDESLLRNTTGYQVSEALGLPAMGSVWADVVLNGELVGNYQLCELIRISKSRVDIFDWEKEAERIAAVIREQESAKGRRIDLSSLESTLKEDMKWVTRGSFYFNGDTYTLSDYGEEPENITGGYLFELSDEYDSPPMFMTKSNLKVMIQEPSEMWTNPTLMSYVQDCWEQFDSAIRSADGYVDTPDGEKHYTQLADLDSMVAFWMTNEILGNNDAYAKSRYAYKDTDSPLRFGPVWDFDWGGGSLKAASSGKGWVLATFPSEKSFYKEFLDDPLFVVRATERYWELRPYLEELIREGGILDTEIDYLQESGAVDTVLWDRKETWPDDARGFEQDADMFRQYMRTRVAWMDEQFDSDDNLLSVTHTSSSAAPYTRHADILQIALPDAQADTVSAHAPAEGLVPAGEDVTVTVTVTDAETDHLLVYVNGLRDQTVSVVDGQAQFLVEAGLLRTDRKNVVSLIGKNAAGTTTYENFTTVLLQ